jgi:hypothetical protein
MTMSTLRMNTIVVAVLLILPTSMIVTVPDQILFVNGETTLDKNGVSQTVTSRVQVEFKCYSPSLGLYHDEVMAVGSSTSHNLYNCCLEGATDSISYNMYSHNGGIVIDKQVFTSTDCSTGQSAVWSKAITESPLFFTDTHYRSNIKLVVSFNDA